MTARLPIPGSDDGKWGDLLNDYLSVSHEADGTLRPISQNTVTNLPSDLAAKVNDADLDAKTATIVANASSATATALNTAYALKTDIPAAAVPQSQALSTATGQFAAASVVTLLNVQFSAAGRLRLYNSTAGRTADTSRAIGVAPDTPDIFYEYDADTNNIDSDSLNLSVGTGAIIYWTLDGGPTVMLTWVRVVA